MANYLEFFEEFCTKIQFDSKQTEGFLLNIKKVEDCKNRLFIKIKDDENF